ncbi:uncharacterized protein LOC134668136 [Cydia fagiglandana]|uniref:uncharacterized protein LOC134668136 n=1 Tax=Cydia fagiglandana TaxID=1458189 RepID=UPI002FEE22DC
MFKIVLLFAGIALCQADLPVTPPKTPSATPPPVRCGVTPTEIHKCLGNPKLVTRDITAQCNSKGPNECERMKCIFQKSGWMSGDAIEKAKITAHFEQFAKDHPDWAPAVNQVKASCLAGSLPTQGVYLNCPAYDTIHCVLTVFFKNAQPSQWSTAAECNYARQFAAVCPICPEDCFAAAIPYGSCNACRLLPQSPQTP